ncbi:hypothetical protein DPEC_G00034530 [Dallia pectoralis]|uniref:Uncharacterized protein n=1 Tax=Dallia pectoralis TaxID=75939 RepID=A0ACC2HD52_DALPE|nr:hypothetical protein DPEC_G00034530 [Dallia pectoralis]
MTATPGRGWRIALLTLLPRHVAVETAAVSHWRPDVGVMFVVVIVKLFCFSVRRLGMTSQCLRGWCSLEVRDVNACASASNVIRYGQGRSVGCS